VAARLEKQLDHSEQNRVKETAGGKSLSEIVSGLVQAIDPDRIEDEAKAAAKGDDAATNQACAVAQPIPEIRSCATH
jgi:type I restriction enzyme, R subunit